MNAHRDGKTSPKRAFRLQAPKEEMIVTGRSLPRPMVSFIHAGRLNHDLLQ